MNSVSVISDNVYAKIGISKIASYVSHGHSTSESLVIFSFEKTWLRETELYAVLNCKAERILILASHSLLNFLTTLRLPGNITLGYYEIPLTAIQGVISSFYAAVRTAPSISKMLMTKRNALTPSECNITLLYIRRLSVTMIARLMSRSYKTISAQKRSAMKKMGVASDVDLMKKKQWILLAMKLDLLKNRSVSFGIDDAYLSAIEKQ